MLSCSLSFLIFKVLNDTSRHSILLCFFFLRFDLHLFQSVSFKTSMKRFESIVFVVIFDILSDSLDFGWEHLLWLGWLLEGVCRMEVSGSFKIGFFWDLVTSFVKGFRFWNLIFDSRRLNRLWLLKVLLYRFLRTWRLHFASFERLFLFGRCNRLLNRFLNQARILSALLQRRTFIRRDTIRWLYMFAHKLTWIVILLVFTWLDDIFFNLFLNILLFLLLLGVFRFGISSSWFSSFLDVVHDFVGFLVWFWAGFWLFSFWNHLFWRCSYGVAFGKYRNETQRITKSRFCCLSEEVLHFWCTPCIWGCSWLAGQNMGLYIWLLNQIYIFVALRLPNHLWNWFIINIFSLIDLSQPLFFIIKSLDIVFIILLELLSELLMSIVDFFPHPDPKLPRLSSISPTSSPLLHDHCCFSVPFLFFSLLSSSFILNIDNSRYFGRHFKIRYSLVHDLPFLFLYWLIIVWIITLLRWFLFLRKIEDINILFLWRWRFPTFFSSLFFNYVIEAIVTMETISIISGHNLSLIF